jgi:predicted HTH transcriptional regulator
MKVQRLITEGESEVLEFKASFGKDVVETLCVFANHDQTERRNGSNESRPALGKWKIRTEPMC